MKTLLKLGAIALLALSSVLVARAALFTLEAPPVPDRPNITVPKKAAVARLARALRIPTISRNVEVIDDAAFDALRTQLEQSFPRVFSTLGTETVNRHALLLTWTGERRQGRPILLMAHTDVVPADDAQGWQKPPFGGDVDGGFIWGRGSLDDKSSVLGILEAVERLIAEGFVPKRTIYLAFGHDEEVGGARGARAISELLEHREVRLAFVVDEGGVVADGIVPGVPGPVALIGVAEKGYLTLRLSVKSEGGHSSMPPEHTAIGTLATAIARIESSPLPPQTAHAKRFFARVGPAMPFPQRIAFANLWLFEPLIVRILSAKPSLNAILRTTTAVTMVTGGIKENVLPKRAEAQVNFRIIPGDTPRSVQAHIEAVVDDPRVEVSPAGETDTSGGFAPSSVSSTDSEGFSTLALTVRQTFRDPDLVVAPYLVIGTTDSRFFARIADDVYRFLPVRLDSKDLARLHGRDERIAVKDYLNTIRFYYLFLKNTAA